MRSRALNSKSYCKRSVRAAFDFDLSRNERVCQIKRNEYNSEISSIGREEAYCCDSYRSTAEYLPHAVEIGSETESADGAEVEGNVGFWR